MENKQVCFSAALQNKQVCFSQARNHNEQFMEKAMNAAVRGGEILLAHAGDIMRRSSLETKESLRDVVIPVERYAEKVIIETLQEGKDAFSLITEESGVISGKSKKPYHWVVDPLDGTVNYVNQIPFYATSIALVGDEGPVVGVIYNPLLQELFYGAQGIGVYKNKTRITLVDKKPETCLFAVSFSGASYDPAHRNEEFLTFAKINDATRGCLRTGSAAMNLALLAEGRLGGCWGKAAKWWDVAAGLLLAKLAGARVAHRRAEKNNLLVNYAATVPSAWDTIRSQVTL